MPWRKNSWHLNDQNLGDNDHTATAGYHPGEDIRKQLFIPLSEHVIIRPKKDGNRMQDSFRG